MIPSLKNRYILIGVITARLFPALLKRRNRLPLLFILRQPGSDFYNAANEIYTMSQNLKREDSLTRKILGL